MAFPVHLRSPTPPPYMHARNCTRPHICASTYTTEFSSTRAFAYPHTRTVGHACPKCKQHRICALRHGLTPTLSQAHVRYLSVTHSICFCLHALPKAAYHSADTHTHARTHMGSLFWCIIMHSSTNTCSPLIDQTTRNPSQTDGLISTRRLTRHRAETWRT